MRLLRFSLCSLPLPLPIEGALDLLNLLRLGRLLALESDECGVKGRDQRRNICRVVHHRKLNGRHPRIVRALGGCALAVDLKEQAFTNLRNG